MDGRSLREHLQSWQRQTGRVPEQLADAPRLPVGCEPLWRDFLALHSTRGSNGFGPERITFPALDAYQRLYGVRFAAWEIEAIRAADAAYIAHTAQQRKPA